MVRITWDDVFNGITKKYKTILADPPWEFKCWSEKGTDKSAVHYYQVMSLKNIMSLPVEMLADRDCVLFLWTTSPFLEYSFSVINAWGFEYKTVAFYWVKKNKSGVGLFTGLGFWTRSNVEPCLLCSKGNPSPKTHDIHEVIHSKVRKHSRKPDEQYERIEALCEPPYIELFAREVRDGWDTLGLETSKTKNITLTRIFSEIDANNANIQNEVKNEPKNI